MARRLAWIACAVALAPNGVAEAQGLMTNGLQHIGRIDTAGQVDVWAFTASAGDNISLALGETEPTTDFSPWLGLNGPDGEPLTQSAGDRAAFINNFAAPDTGTYSVSVRSDLTAQNGTSGYRLTLARAPGTFTTSGGDDGGLLVNGATHTGVITLGDLDVWTFEATAGQHLNLAIGTVAPATGFAPWLRLVTPSGTLLWSTANAAADQVHDATAPETGSYTVLVQSYSTLPAGTGGYALTLAKAPGTLTISPGDQGGLAALGVDSSNLGRIALGDLDAFVFVASPGDRITATVDEFNASLEFSPWVRLVGPTGILLAQDADATSAQIADFITPSFGVYTLLISASLTGSSGSGDYVLTLRGVPPRLPDIAIDFGPAAGLGLFTANNRGAQPPQTTSWFQVHPLSPTVLAVGRLDGNLQDDQVLVFPGLGTWMLLNGTTWMNVHPLDAMNLTAADLNDNGIDDLVATFAGFGIWVRYDDGRWTRLHPLDALDVAAGHVDIGNQTDIVIAFPEAQGVWAVMNGSTWTRIDTRTASRLRIANLDADPVQDVIADFPGNGVWIRYNNSSTWRPIHPLSPDGMATGNVDGDAGGRQDLILSFPGQGLYIFMNNASWARYHPATSSKMETADLDQNGRDDIIIGFQGQGVWVLMNLVSWIRLHTLDAELLAVGRFDGY